MKQLTWTTLKKMEPMRFAVSEPMLRKQRLKRASQSQWDLQSIVSRQCRQLYSARQRLSRCGGWAGGGALLIVLMLHPTVLRPVPCPSPVGLWSSKIFSSIAIIADESNSMRRPEMKNRVTAVGVLTGPRARNPPQPCRCQGPSINDVTQSWRSAVTSRIPCYVRQLLSRTTA